MLLRHYILTFALCFLKYSTAVDPVVLNCEYSSQLEDFWPYAGSGQYACDLQDDFPFLDEVTVSINGTHETGKTNADVTALSIESLTIFQIPKVAEIFPAIKYIKIVNTTLRYLTKENLASYATLLEHLVIQESQIEILEENLFTDFNKIITIDLQNNQIFMIAANAFIIPTTPTEPPASTAASTESPASTAASTESPASTAESTESTASTAASTESSASTAASTESPASTDASSEPPASTDASSEPPASTDASTESPASTAESTESPASTAESTESPASTDASSEPPASTAESTESPASTDASSEPPASTDASTESPGTELLASPTTSTTLANLMLKGNTCKDNAATPADIGNCQASGTTPCVIETFIASIGTSSCSLSNLKIENLLAYQKSRAEQDLTIYSNAKNLNQLNETLTEVSTNLTTVTNDYNNVTAEAAQLKSEIKNLTSKVENLDSQAEKCIVVNGTCRFATDEAAGYSCIAHNIAVNASGQPVVWTGTHNPASATNNDVLGLIIRDLVVEYVPGNIATAFPNLKSLVIKSCGLKKLTVKDFAGAKKLENIKITSNEIATVEAGVFDGSVALANIDLSDNKIKALPSKIFALLTALNSVNLNTNQLTSLKADFLPATNSIKILTATTNQLATIESTFVWRLRNADLIDFTGNTCNQKFDKSTGSEFNTFYTTMMKKC